MSRDIKNSIEDADPTRAFLDISWHLAETHAVAGLCVFIASPKADYINGTLVEIDSGQEKSLIRRFADLLQHVDALASPTMPILPPAAGEGASMGAASNRHDRSNDIGDMFDERRRRTGIVDAFWRRGSALRRTPDEQRARQRRERLRNWKKDCVCLRGKLGRGIMFKPTVRFK
jgi:hypothetical protein